MTVVVDPTTSDASGTTLDDIIRRIRQQLTDRQSLNKLAGGIDNAATTITLKYKPQALAQGSVFSIDDEQFYVWDFTGTSISVERGWNGTIPSFHGDNTIVYVGGKPRKEIVDAVNDELMSLWGNGLYQMKSLSLTEFNYGTWAYTESVFDNALIYDVQWLVPSQTVDWRHLRGWRQSAIDNTIAFGELPHWGSSVRVLYKAPFTKFSDGGQDVQSDAGLQSEATDVLVWGACYRLTIGDEYIRDDFRTQGDTRRASEVPAGAVMRASVAGFKNLHDARLAEERDNLHRRFPTQRRGW